MPLLRVGEPTRTTLAVGDFCDDFGFACSSELEQFDFDTLACDAVADCPCHLVGALPHCVKNYDYFVFDCFASTPIHIGVDDFHWVFAPDDAVAGCNHVNGYVHGDDFLDFFDDQGCEGRQNVAEVGDWLPPSGFSGQLRRQSVQSWRGAVRKRR